MERVGKTQNQEWLEMFHQFGRFKSTHGKSHLGSGAPTWHHCTGELCG